MEKVIILILVILHTSSCSNREEDNEPAKDYSTKVELEDIPSIRFIELAKNIIEHKNYSQNQFVHDFNFISFDDEYDFMHSVGVFDLTQPLEFYISEKTNIKNRYVSFIAINERGYINEIYYGGGKHVISRDDIGSKYAIIIGRIFINQANSKELEIIKRIQRSITIVNNKIKRDKYIPKEYNKKKFTLLTDSKKDQANIEMQCFGSKSEVNKDEFIKCASNRIGGIPYKDFLIKKEAIEDSKDEIYQVTIKDVEVSENGFWSITGYNVFNKQVEKSDTINSNNGIKEKDGAINILFGNCGNKKNCIPTSRRWQYILRVYTPDARSIDTSNIKAKKL